MSKKPRSITPHYSKETKREVLELDKQGTSPFDISARLNVPIPTLTKWIKDGDKILKPRACSKKQTASQEFTENAKKCSVDKQPKSQTNITSDDVYRMFKPLVEQGLLGGANEQDLRLAISKINDVNYQGQEFIQILKDVAHKRREIDDQSNKMCDNVSDKPNKIKKKEMKKKLRETPIQEEEFQVLEDSFTLSSDEHEKEKASELQMIKLASKVTKSKARVENAPCDLPEIQPDVKPKRKYTRKPKPGETETIESPHDIGGPLCDIPQIEPPVKVKRTYTRKPKPGETETIESPHDIGGPLCDIPQIEPPVQAKRTYTRKPKPGETETIESPHDIGGGLCDIPQIEPSVKTKRKYTRKPKQGATETIESSHDLDPGLCDIPQIEPLVKAKRKYTRKPKTASTENTASMNTVTSSISFEKPQVDIDAALCDIPVTKQTGKPKKIKTKKTPSIILESDSDDSDECVTRETPASEIDRVSVQTKQRYSKESACNEEHVPPISQSIDEVHLCSATEMAPPQQFPSERESPQLGTDIEIIRQCSPIKENKDQITVCKPPTAYEKLNEIVGGIFDDVRGTFSALTGKKDSTTEHCPKSPISKTINDLPASKVFKGPNASKTCTKREIIPQSSPLKPSNVVIRDMNVKSVDSKTCDRYTEQLNIGPVRTTTEIKEAECPNVRNEAAKSDIVSTEQCASDVLGKKPPHTGPIILSAKEKERRMILYRRILHGMISDDEEDDEYCDLKQGEIEHYSTTLDVGNVNEECKSCSINNEAEKQSSEKDFVEEMEVCGNQTTDTHRLESDSDSDREPTCEQDVDECVMREPPASEIERVLVQTKQGYSKDTHRLESDSDSDGEPTCEQDVEMKDISQLNEFDIEKVAHDLSLSETSNQLNRIESMRMDVDMNRDVEEDVCEHVRDNLDGSFERQTTTDGNEEFGLINEKQLEIFDNLPKQEQYAQLGLSVLDSDESQSSLLSVGCGMDDRETVDGNTVSASENQRANEFLQSPPIVTGNVCHLDSSLADSKTNESSIGSPNKSLLSELKDDKIDISLLEKDLYLTSEDESQSSSDNEKCCRDVSKEVSVNEIDISQLGKDLELTSDDESQSSSDTYNSCHNVSKDIADQCQAATINTEEWKKNVSSNLTDEELMFFTDADFTAESEALNLFRPGEVHTCSWCTKKVVDNLKASNVNEKPSVAGPANMRVNEVKRNWGSISSSSSSSSSEGSTCKL